jgi:hypothetical protein
MHGKTIKNVENYLIKNKYQIIVHPVGCIVTKLQQFLYFSNSLVKFLKKVQKSNNRH